MKIVIANKEMLSEISKIYISSFPNLLSSKLGILFVEKNLEWFINNKNAQILLLLVSGKIEGFACVTKNRDKNIGAATSMFKNSYLIAIKLIIFKPWLIFHPFFLKKLKFVLRKLFIFLKIIKPRKSVFNEFEDHVGITVIGVNKNSQSKGYGKKIIQAVEVFAKSNNFKLLKLTVFENNLGAINFYKNNGWYIDKKTKDQLLMQKHIL